LESRWAFPALCTVVRAKIRAAAGADAHLRGIAAVGTKTIPCPRSAGIHYPTSGLVDVGEKDLPEGGRFLAKPYSPNALADVLRELIDTRQN